MKIPSNIKLYDYQERCLKYLKNGSILNGGVGSGKSITSLAYFYLNVLGVITGCKDIYVITTAKKRDKKEWEKEAEGFNLTKHGVSLTVDSWNNIGKYVKVSNGFFIFDEQRLVGSGAWVKSFLKIVKSNKWLLLSATPGDTWSDWIPVMVANGYYKNKTEFSREHCIYSRFTKYPKIDRYIGTKKLARIRKDILVSMDYHTPNVRHNEIIKCEYDTALMKTVMKDRWNPYEDKPIEHISQVCYLARKVVNTDPSRILKVIDLCSRHNRLIIFYNFNYELELLRTKLKSLSEVFTIAEWNGQKHEEIPDTDKWIYLVQYTAGAEGWNCTDTDVMIFYSQNYSYKILEQSQGRIDRVNNKFKDLYYYHFMSNANIDLAIRAAVGRKKMFNAANYVTNL